MNKTDLIKIVADAGLNKQEAAIAVNTVFNAMADELAKDGHVTIKDFGSFKTVIKNMNMGRNPITGETLAIPPRKAVIFKTSKELDEKIKTETHKNFYSERT